MKYILLLFISFCFIACGKDSDPDTTSENTQQLTSAEWKYDNGGIGNANGIILIDFSTLTIIPVCMFDNSVRFHADGNGIMAENGNVCTGAPATSNFTWNLSSDGKTLNLSSAVIAGIGGSFKVKEISPTKLTLLKDTTFPIYGAGTAVVNFKH